ncbi:MAG: cytidine deaminase [Chloroflexi bacterium]|nr:cytidine deaminase [Chloroflexota bacterium]
MALTSSAQTLLVDAATNAREHAYAPYSGFCVGAAALLDNGDVVTGANVENASLGLSMCAERVALFVAAQQRPMSVRAVAVVADTTEPVRPCGACRQVLFELAPEAAVLLCNLHGAVHLTSTRALLPLAFDATMLGKSQNTAPHSGQ